MSPARHGRPSYRQTAGRTSFKEPPGQVRSQAGRFLISPVLRRLWTEDQVKTSCETGHHRAMFPMREEGGGGRGRSI